jgi:hypothetical protein
MAFLAGGIARAQDQAWVQIEAQPTRADAMDRARSYAAVFPEVTGYALRSGWFGIVLGPYGREEAAIKLRNLRGEGLIFYIIDYVIAAILAADLAARTLVAPQELPVGVLTAVIGGGYLLRLLQRQERPS